MALDHDTRRWLEMQHEQLLSSQAHMNKKLDEILESFNVHCVENAKDISNAVATAKAAHRRLDEMKESDSKKSDHRWALWLLGAGTFIALVKDWLANLISGRKG